MKRTLGLLLAIAVSVTLVACSADSGPGDASGKDETSQSPTSKDPADQNPTDQSSTDQSESVGDVDFTQVALLTESAAGGQISKSPVLLDSADAVAEFTGQFNGRTLGSDIEAAVSSAKPAAGQVLVGAVVALGCETPTGVSVSNDDGLVITPTGMPKPTTQCFAAVTTVAIVAVAVDAAAVN